MPTYEQSIGAGQSIDFPGGDVFFLIVCNEEVTLKFYDARNEVLDTWEGVKAGLNDLKFLDEQGKVKPFMRVNVYSATAQTVKVAVTGAHGSYQRSQGDVNILGDVTIDSMEKVPNANHGQVTVDDTPTLILQSQPKRKSGIIKNTDSSKVLYVGINANVTTSNGHYLGPGEAVCIDRYTGALYGIVETGTLLATFFKEFED